MLPFISVFGKTVSPYGLCMVTALLLITFLATKKAKQKQIDTETIIIVAACITGFALLFGKILYLLVSYSVFDMISDICNLEFDFLQSGGLVFYGGLLGGLLGARIGASIAQVSLWQLEEAIVIYLPLGHAIGRIGCLLAGCCYGCLYDGPFCISYQKSIFGLSQEDTFFPVQSLEAILNILIMFYLFYYSKKNRKKYDLLFCYLFLYAVIRFILEFLRGDIIRGIYFSFSTGQWISVFIIAICGVRSIVKKQKKNFIKKS